MRAQSLQNTGQAPEIFNTDQGSQFTSEEWIANLEARKIKVSMEEKGRWMDNAFIERLWRHEAFGSLTPAAVYQSTSEAQQPESPRALQNWKGFETKVHSRVE